MHKNSSIFSTLKVQRRMALVSVGPFASPLKRTRRKSAPGLQNLNLSGHEFSVS
jgi:hypothetical protein